MEIYLKSIEHLISKNIIEKDYWFDYSLSPLYFEWNEFAEGFIKKLRSDEIRLKEMNAYFVYENSFSSQSSCSVKDGIYLISITSGFFQLILDNTISRTEDFLKIIEISSYVKYFEDLGSDISYFIKDIILLSVFYHECSHIRHLKIELPTEHKYIEVANDSFQLSKHLFELDADGYSSHFIAMNIIVMLKNKNKEITSENIIPAVVISCVAIMFLLYFQHKSNFDKIYTFEKSHPCNIARVIKYMQGIIGNILKNTKIETNENQILDETVRIAKIMSKELFNIDLLNTMTTSTIKSSESLKIYFDEIDNLSSSYDNLLTYNISS
jgi:hypothetical protein